MTLPVRPAEPRDLPALPPIERSADGVFAAAGIVFPPGPTVIELVRGARIAVLGDPPVGFAAVIDVDGHPHLEQIALEAAHTGRGLGRLLLEYVIEREPDGLTLITFRDVPWNAPWYARYGFTELPEHAWGPQLLAKWRFEIDVGLHDLGPRLIMRR